MVNAAITKNMYEGDLALHYRLMRLLFLGFYPPSVSYLICRGMFFS